MPRLQRLRREEEMDARIMFNTKLKKVVTNKMILLKTLAFTSLLIDMINLEPKHYDAIYTHLKPLCTLPSFDETLVRLLVIYALDSPF